MSPENQKLLKDKFKPIYDLVGEFECGDGWFDLLHGLSEAIVLHINSCPIMKNDANDEFFEGFHVTQVKEKFGSLRFYVSSACDEIYELILRAEVKSKATCEGCGSWNKY